MVVAGLPWEGTNTWGSYSGCEQTPKACRLASLRYGSGYLPEYDVEVMNSLIIGDLGDLPVHSTDVAKTFAAFEEAAARVFAAGVFPLFFGGDHAVTFPILKALSTQRPGRIGVLHFDAHFDNAGEYDGDSFARCCPLRRIAELPDMDPAKIVHIGIRGPRNAPSQMHYAREKGIPVYTMKDIHRLGLPVVLSAAQEIAANGTDGYYVTVCSDIMDQASNPGGPIDFGGLSSGDMCEALFTLGRGRILGLDLVEVYPRLDVREVSIHLLVWLAIYALAGLATRPRSGL
ncbi:MAG: agmatinase family protein [Thermodesulfobacteriota bacterium]